VRVLITGITGFAGRYLADLLRTQDGMQLHGLSRSPRWPAGFEHLADHVQLHQADLLDHAALRNALWMVQPQQIYHLAAFTDAGGSFRDTHRVWEANLHATLQLYDVCLSEVTTKPRILYVSTGAVYGDTGGETITESTMLRPNSPYATSKAAADLASYQYWAAHQLPIIRVRPFNQVGPGQPTNFALGRFADLIARMERRELDPVLNVGNLDAERDFTDVRDMARAYVLLMEKGTPGEAYNAASATSHPMRWFLDRLLEHTRLPITVTTDSSLLRPVETHRLRVDTAKLRQATDWKPTTSLDQSLHDLLSASRAPARA
jgi:GDP-4-dehydro-6-deoxy-D-mannose reductase